MKRHLLLIGPGYLGKEILREFTLTGWKITTASRSSEIQVDISDASQVRDLSEKFSSGAFDGGSTPTHIIHCASASAGRGALADVRLVSYVNTYKKGCENLANFFPDAHLLFTSSTSVYGQRDGSVVTEESLTEPNSETAAVLLDAERAVLENNGTVVRLSGIYGVGKSYLLQRLFKGEAEMEGEGERVLNHIHHHDGASACRFLMEGGYRGVYNVSETTNLTLRETYLAVCEKYALPMPPYTDSEPRNGLNKRVSTEKILDLGWVPEYPSFLDAVEDVVASLGFSKTR